MDFDKKCRICNDGFTLSPDKTKCFVKPNPPQNPRNRIPNCHKFKTENYEACDLCYEGFFLKDENTKCVKHSKPISNCNVYSQTAENTCIFCSNPTFRGSGSDPALQCGKRSNYFANCERFSRLSDKCLECAAEHIPHFTPSVNFERCSMKIKFCVTYNKVFRILQCADCLDSHYLNSDDTKCYDAKNSINGCAKYQKGLKCEICKQGFYLDIETFTCSYHNIFKNCSNLSVTVKDYCNNCEQEGIRTQITHVCTSVSSTTLAADPNCNNWDKNQNCNQCFNDFVLKSTEIVGDEGSQIVDLCTLEKGCLKWNETLLTNKGGCEDCQSDYFHYLSSCNKSNNENCMYSFETAIVAENLTYGTDLESGFPCQICNEKRLFVVEQSDPEFRCISLDFFKEDDKVQNCLSFEKDGASYICKDCRRNHKRTCSR